MSDPISRTINALHNVGVNVFTEGGEIRELTDILNDLSDVWNSMNTSEKQNVVDNLVNFSMSNSMHLVGHSAEKTGKAIASALKNISEKVH